MSSKTDFKCDFCQREIVKATKNGLRGYCAVQSGIVSQVIWSSNPYDRINGPHICSDCITSLMNSKAFKE